MAGEQLPPVVATLEGEDDGFLAMLERDVAAIRSAAGEIDAVLASLDIGAAFSDSLSGAHIETLNTDEIAQGLSEGLGGVGDAIAQDMGSELSQALTAAGAEGGQGFAEGLVEGAAGAGDVVADGLKTSLGPALESAGADGGQVLAQAIVSETSGLGAEVGQSLHSITDEAGAAGVAAGHALADGVTAAVGPAGAAGMEAGAALAAGIAAGAIGARSEASRIAESIQADLEDALQQAGAASGGALMDGIASGAASAGGKAASRTAEAIQANLSDALAQAGASSGAAYAEAVINEITAVLDASSDQMDAMITGLVGKVMTNASGAIADTEPAVAAQAAESATQVAQAAAEAAETTLAVGAQQAAESFGEALAEGLEEAEPEVAAAAASMGDVFNSLYLRGQGIGGELATAMTEAFGGVLTSTADFTGREAELWAQFNEEISTDGIDSAINRAQLLAQQLQRQVPVFDPIAANVSTLGAPLRAVETEASGVKGALAGAGKAAESAGSDFGGLGAMMTGPVGMGAMMLMSVLPMVGSLFDSNSVSAATFTASLQQDSNAVGDNTAATIQQTLASSNLNDMAQNLGVSQATLIEYAAGESQAQSAVTAAYNAKSDALNTASNQEGIHSKAEADTGNAADQAANHLADEKNRLDEVTAAVQQAIVQNKDNNDALLAAEQTTQIYNASVANLGSQMLLNAQQTNMQNDATVRYTGQLLAAANEGNAFNLALDASYDKMELNVQASSQASVGLLHLGDNQNRLNTLLYDSVDDYSSASQEASAYGGVLQSYSGTMNDVLSDEAQFTIALSGLTDEVKTNGTSLDQYNAKGAQNIQMFTQAANAADKAATAVYQNARQHENADQAWNTANNYLNQEKNAFEAAAEKAGFNKQQVEDLANELYKLPPNPHIDIGVNDSEVVSALNAMEALNGQIAAAGGQSGHNVPVGMRAAGGPVEANNTYIVGERGPELVTFGASGYVTPTEMLKPATLGAGGGFSGGVGAGGGGVVNVILNIEGSLVHQNDLFDGLQAGALQFENRNSYGGLVSGR